jgi:hypothetical protein
MQFLLGKIGHLLPHWFFAQLMFDLEDGGDMVLRNVGADTDYTALYPRRWQLP